MTSVWTEEGKTDTHFTLTRAIVKRDAPAEFDTVHRRTHQVEVGRLIGRCS